VPHARNSAVDIWGKKGREERKERKKKRGGKKTVSGIRFVGSLLHLLEKKGGREEKGGRKKKKGGGGDSLEYTPDTYFLKPVHKEEEKKKEGGKGKGRRGKSSP